MSDDIPTSEGSFDPPAGSFDASPPDADDYSGSAGATTAFDAVSGSDNLVTSTDADTSDAAAPADKMRKAPGSRGPKRGAHFAPDAKQVPKRRRWPKRVIIASSVVLVVVIVLIGGGYFYARFKFDEIKKFHIKQLTTSVAAGQPFDVLLVGSDSRQFVDTSTQQQEFGNKSTETGQRSDVVIIARVSPATHQVKMLSIPRDTYVHIPGNVPYISGYNRINAAFNSGPSLLVETIQQDFGIPITHYVEVNFEGFSNIVTALGGVYLDFKDPVKDKNSGLAINKTGCQLLSGPQALSLVRSRDESYSPSAGVWDYDGMGDWSRIRRQDAFFHAVINRANSEITDPLAMINFVNAVVGDVGIDDTFSLTGLYDLGNEFRGLGQSGLTTEVLPTTPQVLNGNDILTEAQPFGSKMISQFLAWGYAPTGKSGSKSGNPTPAVTPAQITVSVLNGNGKSGVAATAATNLKNLGYVIGKTANAANFKFQEDLIQYGPRGKAAAERLAASLIGGATLQTDPSLTGNRVILTVGAAYSGVITSTSTPTTTVAGGTGATSVTTPPADVVFDNPKTLPEPWDPTPC